MHALTALTVRTDRCRFKRTATARVWAATGRENLSGSERSPRRDRGSSVQSRRMGAKIVTASEDSTARVWAVDGSGSTHLVLRGHERGSNRSGVQPRWERSIATASIDSTARVWAADGTGEPDLVLRGHEGFGYGVAFSPDGSKVATASRDKYGPGVGGGRDGRTHRPARPRGIGQ